MTAMLLPDASLDAVGLVGADAQEREAPEHRTAESPGSPIMPRESDCRRSFRRHQPISAYVGANGSGKTLLMVHDTLPSLYAGRQIYTTVPLFYPGGMVPDNVHLLSSWAQLLDVQHADILFDEVSAIASARDTESLPPQIATLLQQLRKRDLILRWTAPSWQRADRILRETTKLLTICHGWFPRKDDESEWRQNRFFTFRSYDSGDYTDFTSAQSTMKRLKPLSKGRLLLSRHIAPKCYDTFAAVSTIGTVLLSGRCAVCGGRRRVPECICEDYRQGLKHGTHL